MSRTTSRGSIGFRTILLAAILATGVHGQVLLNEILFDPLPDHQDAARTHQWVEIYNKGSEHANLSRYVVSNGGGRDGTGKRLLPAVSLPPGAYLAVHISQGADQLDFSGGGGHFYTQDPPGALLWNPARGEVALYGPSGIADFVAWRNTATPYTPGAAHDDAVAAKIWTRGESLNRDVITENAFHTATRLEPGYSLGRDRNSTDRNISADFDPRGGQDAFSNTPGGRNYRRIEDFIRSALPSAGGKSSRRGAAAAKKWTVMFYAFPDSRTAWWVLSDLVDIQQAGGSTDDVNYVAMIDFPQAPTYRGRVIGSNDRLDALTLEAPPGEGIVIAEQNMADGATLAAFLAWAKEQYPAEHYALVFNTHGGGWKGLGPDVDSIVSGRPDYLYMSELTQGLDGHRLDVIAFEACLMAGVEVAYQIRNNATYMFGTEEIGYAGDGNWSEFAAAISANPQWSPREFVETMHRLVSQKASWRIFYTYSVIDLSKMGDLSTAINTWAQQLHAGVKLIQRRNDLDDNVQMRIRAQALEAIRFSDNNYMDLYDFATRVDQDPDIPRCVKTGIPAVLKALREAVIAESHGQLYSTVRGLHIYFPEIRVRYEQRLNRMRQEEKTADPFDHPSISRQRDGGTRRGNYARSHDALPLKAQDQDDIDEPPLDPRTEWTAPVAAGFRFPLENSWPVFLERYYHPVADNRILFGTTPSGETIEPYTIGAGECANGIDFITVPLDSTVALSAEGSSDPDGFPPRRGRVYVTDWDFDATKECEPKPCREPYTIEPFKDAMKESNNNVDADRDLRDTTWDDRDETSPTPDFVCKQVGTYVVTLNVSDGDHISIYHNTYPDGGYVHPQTDSHQSVIQCTLLPAGLSLTAPPSFIQADDLIKITFASADASRTFLPFYPVTVSGTGVVSLTANGAAVPDGGKATVRSDAAGLVETRFIAGPPGPGQLAIKPAGAQNFPVRLIIQQRLAPLPTELNVITPPATVPAGQQTSLTIEVKRAGQPLRDAIITASADVGDVQFVNGTRFRSDSATQVRTGADGRTPLTFVARSGGPVELDLISGAVNITQRLRVTGGTTPAPNRLQIAAAPPLAPLGEEVGVRLRALSQNLPVGGQVIQAQLLQGKIESSATSFTLTTDADGYATFRFKATDAGPLKWRATVSGTTVSVTFDIPVRAQ